jgi:hypothetical protein
MKTLNRIREEGISVLNERLGPADTIRFMRQFDNGYGDYTRDREKILGNQSLNEIIEACDKLRAEEA